MLVSYMVLSTVLSVRSTELTSSHISEKIKSQNMHVIVALLSEGYVGNMVNQSFFYAVAKLDDHTMVSPIPDYTTDEIKKLQAQDSKITLEEMNNMRVLSEIKNVFLYGNTTYDKDKTSAAVYGDSILDIKNTLNLTLNKMGLKLDKFNWSNVKVGLKNGHAVNYSLNLNIDITDQSGKMSLFRTYTINGDADFTGLVDPAIAREFKKLYDKKCPPKNLVEGTDYACNDFSSTTGYLEKVYLFKNGKIANPDKPNAKLKNGDIISFSGLTKDDWWYGPIVVYNSQAYDKLISNSNDLTPYTLFIDINLKTGSINTKVDSRIGSFGHLVKFSYIKASPYTSGGPVRSLTGYETKTSTLIVTTNKELPTDFDTGSDGDPIANYYFKKLSKCGGAYGGVNAKCALITNTTMYDVENMRDMMVCQHYFKNEKGPSILQRMMVDSYNKTSSEYGLASIIVGDFIGGANNDMGNPLEPVLKDKSSRIDIDLFNPNENSDSKLIRIMGMAGMKNKYMATNTKESSVGHFYISSSTAKKLKWNNLNYETYIK